MPIPELTASALPAGPSLTEIPRRAKLHLPRVFDTIPRFDTSGRTESPDRRTGGSYEIAICPDSYCAFYRMSGDGANVLPRYEGRNTCATSARNPGETRGARDGCAERSSCARKSRPRKTGGCPPPDGDYGHIQNGRQHHEWNHVASPFRDGPRDPGGPIAEIHGELLAEIQPGGSGERGERQHRCCLCPALFDGRHTGAHQIL